MMPQADGKTFFLGIGAAKSGTSWIYDFLANHNEVQPGPIKEMHVLNSNFNCGMITAIRELPWHRFAGRKWLIENLWKAYYRADLNRYYSTYERLLSRECMATGEISTSYMTIPQETLRIVQKRFAERKIRVVGLLVLRDPVDRMLSEIKFRKRLSRENRYVKEIRNSLDEVVTQKILKKQSSHYREALSAMQQVFPQEDRFVFLYEELFKQATIDSLCNIIGISSRPAKLTTKVNATPSDETISDEILSKLRSSLDEEYECSKQYFGEERLREHWRYY